MSKIADKLANKLMGYFDDKNPQNQIKKAVLSVGIRAAIKYLHYQSMKGWYEIQNKEDQTAARKPGP